MTTFTKEELLHIATLSGLKLDDQEIPVFTEQIKAILGYVDQLHNVPGVQVAVQQQPNVLRDDVSRPTDATAILATAPETDDGFFVVPKILDEK